MNLEQQEPESAALALTRLKQGVGKEVEEVAGAVAGVVVGWGDDGAATVSPSTADAKAARVRAAPSPTFAQAQLFADFAKMGQAVVSCNIVSELEQYQAQTKAAKRR